MKKKKTGVVMSAVFSAAMLAGTMPTAVTFAQGASQVSATAEVKDFDGDFENYNIKADVTVEDGKITDLTVEPDDSRYTDDNDPYLKWATEGRTRRGGTTFDGVVKQILDKQSTDGIDTVSGATCTSEAIIEAVKSALSQVPEEKPEEPAKEETPAKTPAKTEEPDSNAGEKPAQDSTTKEDTQKPVEELYVLMNIPYADFYASETSGAKVDAVSSATQNKWKTQAGSYNQKDNEITGITYPVKATSEALKSLNKVADEEALKSAPSYSYTELSEAPAFFKELSTDGTAKSFGKTTAKEETAKLNAELLTSSKYGDYQINTDGEFGKVYGVVIKTKEGDSYILRHLENIWRNGQQLSWSIGVKTQESHGNTLSFEAYKGIEGQTIQSLTYYTDKGVTKYDTGDIYVPYKAAEAAAEVADADVNDDTTAVTLTGFPADFTPSYVIDGNQADVSNDAVNVKGLSIGNHTFTVNDASGKYAPVETTFIVKTSQAKAQANADGTALVPADGVSQEEFEAYIKNIASVEADGKSYNASGKRSVVVVKPDGVLDKTTEALAGKTSADVNVKSTGYPDLAFTYTSDVYVLMNIPYSVFYGAEGAESADVDTVSSATNKTGNYGKAGGAYHSGTTASTDAEGNTVATGSETGSQVKGVTWPVKISNSADLEKLGGELIKNDSSVTTATVGRGQASSNLLKGYQALTEAPAYSYYVLPEAPANFLELKDGIITTGSDSVQKENQLGVDVRYGTNWGDVQLDLVDALDANNKIINAIVLTADDGTVKGLYHLDQIWSYNEVGWKADVTAGLDGKTITNVRYYTSIKDEDLTDDAVPAYENYIYDYPVNIPVNSVYTGDVTAEFENKNTIALSGLPADAQNVKAKVYHTTGGRGAVLTYLTPLEVDPADDDIDPVSVDVADGKIIINSASVTNKAGTTAEYGNPLDETSYIIELSSDNYIFRKTSAEYKDNGEQPATPAEEDVKPGEVNEEPANPAEDPTVAPPTTPSSETPETNYEITEGNGATFTKGSKKNLSFSVNALTSKYTGISIDGTDYQLDVEPDDGDLSFEIYADFLETLEAGEHEIVVKFEDGNVKGSFIVAEVSDSASDPNQTKTTATGEDPANQTVVKSGNTTNGAASAKPAAANAVNTGAVSAGNVAAANNAVVGTTTNAPSTGDKNNGSLWAGVAVAAGAAAAAVTLRQKRKKTNR